MDSFEYGSVVAISIVMTLFGMTEGLALGVLCAALTFTLQAGRHVPPIRGSMSARTLRSSRSPSPLPPFPFALPGLTRCDVM